VWIFRALVNTVGAAISITIVIARSTTTNPWLLLLRILRAEVYTVGEAILIRIGVQLSAATDPR